MLPKQARTHHLAQYEPPIRSTSHNSQIFAARIVINLSNRGETLFASNESEAKMSYDFSLMLSTSNRPGSHTDIRQIPALMRRTSGLFLAAAALLALSSAASAIEKNPATEWLQENVQNAMQPAEILALLNDTVGA